MNTMPLNVTLVCNRAPRYLAAAIGCALCCWTFSAEAADSYVPFTGEKSEWHGFDRYDFVMDDNTLEITPITAPESEVKSSGVDRNLKDGKRRCVVVVPKQPAAGNPWSWQACYWNHEPQTEVELLKRGFHIAFVAPDARGQGKAWDAWYDFLTKEHGLSKKPAFVGMSKGGVNEYNWGVAHPDCVACIYADNPAIYPEDLAKLDELAKRDVPVLQIVGTHDFLYHAGNHAIAVEQRYLEYGGRVTMIIKEGTAHHPHSLANPKPIADWIERNMQPPDAPDFIDDSFRKSSYYSAENKFIELPEEKTYATCRGPGYTPCYRRYDAKTSSQWNIGGMSIVVPETPATGKPWVLQCDRLERDAAVDQALLARGFSIVVAPLEGQPGPAQKDWDATYKFMIDHGFSKTPLLAGAGAGAGEAYAWAILNPDKVSCIYADNPLMCTLTMTKTPLADGLPALAKAGIPLWHECGSRDPWLESQTRAVEKRYKELGGKITVVVNEGQGHTPFAPQQVQPIVDFVVAVQKSN
jgi:hypothetical protein